MSGSLPTSARRGTDEPANIPTTRRWNSASTLSRVPEQALRPEIFARINEKLVFEPFELTSSADWRSPGSFCRAQIEFLAGRGHKLESGQIRAARSSCEKDFIQKLGARPMRDAVEKLAGDAAATSAGRAPNGKVRAEGGCHPAIVSSC